MRGQDEARQPSRSVPIDASSRPQSTSTISPPYPSFMSTSQFPPDFFNSIPSSSSTAYTRILTPPETRPSDLPSSSSDPKAEQGGSSVGSPTEYREPETSDNSPCRGPDPSKIPTRADYPEPIPNPILDIGRYHRPSQGRGTLYPGSTFRGKQTSGRSSYEVEVRILDVDFASSTLSGYLSISHLTDTHPKLTTFFSGEIIGQTYGFLTGTKYYAQATEQDDFRHWSRFDRFHQVRSSLRRPGLTMHDMERSKPGGEMRERPYVFMRWKERFLVPDHKIRDISGASFAGFYYLQLELEDPRPMGVPSSINGTGSGSGSRKSETVYLSGRPSPRSQTFPRRESTTTLSPSTNNNNNNSNSANAIPSTLPTSPARSTSSSVRQEEPNVSILPSPPPGVSMNRSLMSRLNTNANPPIRGSTEKDTELGTPVLKVRI
jgi:hypothetical protein